MKWKAIWKGSHNPILRGQQRSPWLLTTYLRHGIILQAFLRWLVWIESCFLYGCQPKNSGTPKSSILIGFSIINHPFWGPTPIFWKHPYYALFSSNSCCAIPCSVWSVFFLFSACHPLHWAALFCKVVFLFNSSLWSRHASNLPKFYQGYREILRNNEHLAVYNAYPKKGAVRLLAYHFAFGAIFVF